MTELPLTTIPQDILQKLEETPIMAIVEEHVQQGGLGMQCAYLLTKNKIQLRKFIHRAALGYPSGLYGSQDFHRAECAMDVQGIQNMVLQELSD